MDSHMVLITGEGLSIPTALTAGEDSGPSSSTSGFSFSSLKPWEERPDESHTVVCVRVSGNTLHREVARPKGFHTRKFSNLVIRVPSLRNPDGSAPLCSRCHPQQGPVCGGCVGVRSWILPALTHASASRRLTHTVCVKDACVCMCMCAPVHMCICACAHP